MDNMADETVTGTDAGNDSFEQEFEAARAEQSAVAEQTEAAASTEAEAGQEEGAQDSQDQAVAREPLPPEEIEKRWKDTRAALKTERADRQREEQARKALEREVAELRAGRAAPQKQQETAADGPPDPIEDPLGALEWLQSKVAANDAKEAEQRQTVEARQREAQEVQALTREFSEHEADFREETLDYDDAVKHLRESRVQELVLFGYSEADAINLFAQEVIATLRDVKQRGLNPAQVAYGMAKQRGYAPKAAGASKLETIARGQAASKTLSGAGGKASGELTVEGVGNLKGAAFDTAFAKLMAQERERERRLG